MADSASWKELKLETTATYRIRVQGRLDKSWSDRLAGMKIRIDPASDKPPLTILEGQLADQAALSGILNALYELHLPLLSVEILDGSYCSD